MRISRIVKETRSEQIPIRFSQKERETVERYAAKEHDYASNFLRRIILKQIGLIEDIDGEEVVRQR